MSSKKNILFVIGRELSLHVNEMGGDTGDKINIVFAGTDEADLRNYTAGKKLIVNEGIRDFYIDDSILFINQKEFDDLKRAIGYLLKGHKAVYVVFMTGDPLSLAVSPMIAQEADELNIKTSFIGVKTENEDKRVTEENLKYFLKNRYRLYIIDRINNEFSLQANEEDSRDELLIEVINSLVKSFKQAEKKLK